MLENARLWQEVFKEQCSVGKDNPTFWCNLYWRPADPSIEERFANQFHNATQRWSGLSQKRWASPVPSCATLGAGLKRCQDKTGKAACLMHVITVCLAQVCIRVCVSCACHRGCMYVFYLCINVQCWKGNNCALWERFRMRIVTVCSTACTYLSACMLVQC